ncbi:flagellar filament capping protein FliD [Alloacidobacterium dinghuense]|uniref:Flagellar hook-associated protein 2 n=1 Tax=Alloacidobacterium dinghuense TaxID=2763107 RepID=A0A7G8BPI3_9BACT|nr:flagellar filament capping protein FliD [Alloacidobacterium dinghuense]QNI34453.1 flagellar filament capping protein FliD [Alloacidobacterium dinghuense]
MGTVGLSFGSPTSGAGFDVTSTVNQIVTNMQAVETPWKNQLTALQAQNTALTSIGTDLSSLSTAMQSLTDFQGVLSEKQGSSSDTSVLQLSSAATSAVAGSHTIIVQSLATTSSYVGSTIGASDTLSGSLTLNAKTINIDSTNNTLSSLASAINSGSYGVTANVITDASGSRLSLVSQTSGASGTISVTSSLTDSNTSSSVGFSQTQPGADAQLIVDGASVSSASNTVTNAIQGVTFQLLSANTGESVQVEITNNNSDVESALNTFVTDYNKVLGDLNTQEGNDSSGNPEPLFGNPTIATIQQSLQTALTFLQPANTAASSSSIGTSDTLTGNISISVGSGTAQSIAVPTGKQTLAGLAAAINSANIGVTATVITAGSGATLSLTNANGGAAGAINVNSTGLTDSTTSTAVTFGSAQSNGITSITQLGVSVNNDGTLVLNTDTLSSVLNSNYQDVVNFFQPSGGFTSFGGNFSTILDNLGTSASNGAIKLALQENSTVESQLNTNISNEETTISAQKTQLTTELNQANFILTEIPQELQQIDEMYSAITGYNQKQNG